ncbi:MAG: hypothetical protein GQF41_4447 [Candidatus Rifleibacterium amylolyticum]|nr:MAG: hypothetical protein GQF41_4447 [Candidatus Rifleibacterium amylolyticum]
MKFNKTVICAIFFISLAMVGFGAGPCCPGHDSDSTSTQLPAKTEAAAATEEAADTSVEKNIAESAVVEPQTAAKPKMIEFGSKQCKACKAMEPVMENLKKSHSEVFDIEFVDVWLPENQTFAKSYSISSIPTQVFLNAAGKEIARNTGFFSEESILAKWRELGVDVDANKTDTPAED